MKFVRCALAGIFLLAFTGPGTPHTSAAVLINEIMYHPSSESILEEFIELHNTAATSVSLANWRFSRGVQFTFPDVTIPADGYLVVAADVGAFTNRYPGVTNVVGGWTGRLSNSRNDLDLDDAAGKRVDSVTYADEGDWTIRMRSPPDRGHRGWMWHAEHDGLGKSLELVNPQLSNNHGQNWAASLVGGGTPGAENSVVRTNIAPLILSVQHLPPIPRSLDNVLVIARLLDEHTSGLSATLYWRPAYTNLPFAALPMFDDGAHDDGVAADGIVAATIPAQANNAIIEFYISATDLEAQTRTWPAPVVETNGVSLGQAANALYQVDDSPRSGHHPLYKLIMREADRAELAQIGRAPFPGESQTDATMNGTFISIDGTGTDVRYLVGIRNRGNGSRSRQPNSYRVSFNADQLWKGISALNLNGQYTHVQLLGAVLSLKAGLGGADSRPVQVRVNNLNLGANSPLLPTTGSRMFGTMYVANEAINSDWAEHWYPDDSSGNIYRANRDLPPPDFVWRGTNYLSYTNTFFKRSNTAENDWSDLLNLLRTAGTNDLFTTESIRRVINVEQWMSYVAVMAIFNNRETSPNRGYNDDYFMYAGINDPRFLLMYYDLDTIMGEGDSPGATDATIFGAMSNNGIGEALSRFLQWPEFEPIYYRTLQRLLDTTFSEAEFDATVDQTLGDFVPEEVIARLKTWMSARRACVQAVIAPYLAAHPAPPAAIISGEPRSPAPFRTAILHVSGEGVTQYRFRLNDGAFGAATPIGIPITLTNLPDGSTNTVVVIGAGLNNVWQSETSATHSKTWVVNTNIPAVRINEVLARNVAASNHFGTFPDLIELYNEGSTTLNLSGLRLTDRIISPNKYTFPNGTMLAPGAYLVLLANNADGTPGTHLGFSLDQDGEGVFLFDKAGNGGALLDAVEFGLQLPDLSVGRLESPGEFLLTQPSFGGANVPKALGDSRQLRINEWLASEFTAAATDFVELYNPEPEPVALGGLYLTDNPIGLPARHCIAPLTFIAAKDYRVFKADGDPEQGLDHLNFKLAAEQGLIALLAADQQIIDVVLYGPQTTDISQGRVPDGSNRILFISTPSAGSANPGPPVCTITGTNVSLISLTQMWKYNETSNLDGVNWTAPGYNDGAWPQGQGLLAFESNPVIANLIRTTLTDPGTPPPGLTAGHACYFRTTVDVPGYLTTGFTFTVRAYIDDGAILYVNGSEVTPRIRMDAGIVTNGTFASASPPFSGSDALGQDVFTIPSHLLVEGTNVIAVEVHQRNASSSDIVWGMELEASLQTTNCGQSAVVLNEVLASNQSFTNAAGRTPDWIELINVQSNAIDLGDMSLSDSTRTPRKWVFPANTILAPGARMIVEFDDRFPVSPTNAGFALNANSDAIYLFRSLADGGAMLDSLRFGLQAADFSIGRIPDGAGPWVLTLPTRASANVSAGLGNASSLRINEWMTAPASGDDWIELYNPNSQPVELTGLALTDNPSLRAKSPFPALSFIAPNGHQQLIADGNQNSGADHLNFSLNSTTGFIGLYWPIGTHIDVVSHGLQSADVSQGRFLDGAENVVSFPGSASPGAANFRLLPDMVISEVLSHTDPPLEDAVEIHNTSSNAVDISGWYLSNDAGDLRKYLVPLGTVIAPGGYRVFYQYQFGTNASPDAWVPFSFNSAHGDEAYLSAADAEGRLTGYRALAVFGAAANGVSFGRFLTSAGNEFVAMSRRSFGMDTPFTMPQFRTGSGSANPYPLVGPIVISEINYQPAAAYEDETNAAEFLELLNITSDAVKLYDPDATTNTWSIAGGVEFLFPPNVTLAANGSLMIVSFDPADAAQLDWFRSAYQIPTNVPVFGPWSGALADEGEDIRLLKPDPPQTAPQPDAGFVPCVLVEHVHYLPSALWPTNEIGSGASLQRVTPAQFGNEPLNWFAAPTSAGIPANDRDHDGLPDYWEAATGLDPDDEGSLNGPDGDPDKDGLTNAEELLAGTHPNDPADYLRIVSLARNSPAVRIRFQPAAGRSYSVLFSDASPGGPWFRLADVPVSVGTNLVEIVDPNPGAARRFYRLETPASGAP